jgi:hypothetical protein
MGLWQISESREKNGRSSCVKHGLFHETEKIIGPVENVCLTNLVIILIRDLANQTTNFRVT